MGSQSRTQLSDFHFHSSAPTLLSPTLAPPFLRRPLLTVLPHGAGFPALCSFPSLTAVSWSLLVFRPCHCSPVQPLHPQIHPCCQGHGLLPALSSLLDIPLRPPLHPLRVRPSLGAFCVRNLIVCAVFPVGSAVKNLPAKAGDDPWDGKIC